MARICVEKYNEYSNCDSHASAPIMIFISIQHKLHLLQCVKWWEEEWIVITFLIWSSRVTSSTICLLHHCVALSYPTSGTLVYCIAQLRKTLGCKCLFPKLEFWIHHCDPCFTLPETIFPYLDMKMTAYFAFHFFMYYILSCEKYCWLKFNM